MPDSFSRLSVQSNQAIREKIVSKPVAAIKIKCRRPRRRVDNAALSIERHARPVVRPPAVLPGVLRPSLVTRLTRMGNRMERPAKLSGADRISSYVAGWRGQSLGIASANDYQVLVNDPRARQRNRLHGRIASQILAKVDAPISAKFRNRLARYPI